MCEKFFLPLLDLKKFISFSWHGFLRGYIEVDVVIGWLQKVLLENQSQFKIHSYWKLIVYKGSLKHILTLESKLLLAQLFAHLRDIEKHARLEKDLLS